MLEQEPRPAQQVPLLLRMGELPLALEKAAHSADVELVHLVLLNSTSCCFHRYEGPFMTPGSPLMAPGRY